MGLLCIVGFALLGFFSSHPEHLKGGQSLVTDADYLFPHYIENFIPVGMEGLVVAALFVPSATPFGAILGAVYGLVAAALWAFWDVITGLPALSFQWIIGISLLVHLVSGCLLSPVPTRG